MIVTVSFDGGCRSNPNGPASSAAIVQDADGRTLRHVGRAIGIASNNVAEWTGLRLGLEAAHELGATGVRAFGDSMLVVKQFAGEYAIAAEGLRAVAMEVSKLAQAFPEGVVVQHVRREFNRAADAIATAVLDGTYLPESDGPETEPCASPRAEVAFVVAVELDPAKARAALAAGATLKALRKQLAAEVESKLIRAGVVGEYSVRPARIRG